MLEKYDGFIFDLDGTIYLDDKLIPKADIVVNKILELNKKKVFVSNKTTGTVVDYYKFLISQNLHITQNEILNSTVVIKKYLQKKSSSQYFFSIGEQKFINELKDIGLTYTEDHNLIDIVIITLDRTLNYSKLEIAARALDRGAKFYAANIDNTCPVLGGEILDAGSTISALEKRTNKKLEKHFGKPSKYILDEALATLTVDPDKCLIIGDRLETDIAMGNQFGIDTALVKTGVTRNFDNNSEYQPTYIINSIFDLLN